jgi:DNA-binding response OmpR family regulator
MSPHILVVDDEALNLEIIAEYLDGADFSADYCTSGEEAWARLENPEAHYDAVLLDRMMPGLDGMALLHRIKQEARFASLPVVMQTAACNPTQIREGLEAGAYYYLTKPYEREGLLAILRAALTDARQRRWLREQESQRWRGLEFLRAAHFEIRTLHEAGELALFIAQACPEPDKVHLGLSELLLNAVEHGNLEISYAEKARLKQQDAWQQEVERRAALPQYRDRRVHVHLTRSAGELVIRIVDQGAGFDWRPYLEFSPERAFDPNGRGIALARAVSFARLEYEKPGNVVTATVPLAGATA